VQQIIDDLLFKLQQTNDEKQWPLMKVYDFLKQQKTGKHQDDNDERDGSEVRLLKQCDSHAFTTSTIPMSTPLSIGLSLNFDHL
jgi:hypothetical protein